jgi:Icc-related predicted phosphoesterase
MTIYILGDVHGYFSVLNYFLRKLHTYREEHEVFYEKDEYDIVLQVGDFGFWPKLQGQIRTGASGGKRLWDQYGINNQNIKIYWCEGNHEDLPTLFEAGIKEHMQNIYWMKRGSVLTLPDGRNVMFIGGAKSIDKQYRIEGVSWFPEEIITNEDIENLPDVKIDIMITHTAPMEFSTVTRDNHLPDPSRYMLSEVLKKYRPDLWFFGHFHKYYQGHYSNTNWYGLADINSMERYFVKI